jgi:glycosyltransferase involved in cell wall biosynthesis
MKTLMFFHRNFRRFSGGHLKMLDYFHHVVTSSRFEPRICFTKRSVWTEENPWQKERTFVSEEWPPPDGTPLLIGNMSWRFIPEDRLSNYPIINLVQDHRCSWPDHPQNRTLSYRATRICVSADVAEAICRTGKVNGPVHVIRAGIDRSTLPSSKPWEKRSNDILVVGYKRPDLAAAAFARLNELVPPGTRIKLLEAPVPRAVFLDLLSDSRVALLLPKEEEGFYLPALEAISLGCLTVCPDAIGNRSLCKPDVTCWMPPANPGALAIAAIDALGTGEPERDTFVSAGQQAAVQFDLSRERQDFHELLDAWTFE